MNKTPLTFEQYIQEYFPHYEIDKDNADVIQKCHCGRAGTKNWKKAENYICTRGYLYAGRWAPAKQTYFICSVCTWGGILQTYFI